jgi:hypothetical protein
MESSVIALEEFYSKTGIHDVELFMFTDNMVSENAFFELVLRMRLLEMHGGWKLHVIHIAGKCIIQQGTNELSRGDIMSGVMRGVDMLTAPAASSVGSRPGGRVIYQQIG